LWVSLILKNYIIKLSKPQFNYNVTSTQLKLEVGHENDCKFYPPTTTETQFLFERLNQVNLNFANLSLADKFKVMLCPTTAFTTKLIHRFIKQMFATRGKHAEKYNL